jgi:hypothetical protein
MKHWNRLNTKFLIKKIYFQEYIVLQYENGSLQFADKFYEEIKDKNQLQRFLGSLNYISDY